MTAARRVRYSRWDGTQVGFEFDADDIFGEITDDLLYTAISTRPCAA